MRTKLIKETYLKTKYSVYPQNFTRYLEGGKENVCN